MAMNGWLGVLAVALLGAQQARAQERVDPLQGGAQRPDNTRSMRKAASLHEVFLYEYLPQTLPIVDDFSIDRTRHRNAAVGDPDVALTETIYYIEVDGNSTPGMAYALDTTFHYTIDLTQPDTTIIHVEANPSDVAVLRDPDTYPATPVSVTIWPPYTMIDTVGDPTTDILPLDPTLIQDSLLLYTVTALGATYTNPDNTTRPLILWEDDDAYVNGNFPIDPPTIGVATLDGMDRTGWPYLPTSPNTQGLADHLTSVPIDLQFPAGDSIYLSFFSEPIGRSGDIDVHAEDSLRLEFFAPDENKWYLIWSRPQVLPIEFTQVMVPITDGRFLKTGFRMRFSNKATLGGAIDQWHLDYVRLGRNRSISDVVLQDVAFVYPETSMLQTYTSVPYAKFISAPSSYMAQNVTLVQKNLDTQDKFIVWGYVSTEEGGATATCDGPGNNIADNAGTTYTSVHPVSAGPCNYTYPTASSEASFYRNAFWEDSGAPDGCTYNDSVVFVQELSNYYSYDDGSAEAGYSLTSAGAKMAMRFDTQGGDSLRALRLYFDPIFTYNSIFNDPTDGSFLITVWSSLQPENIIFQNVSFSSPQYNLWGPDRFVEYALDSTIFVQNTFYVGWVQTNDTKMYLGLDRNRDNHDKMSYNVGGEWAQTAQQGSWMIRPVMVADVDPFAGVEGPVAPATLTLVPNPAGDAFRLHADNGADIAGVELLDAMGRRAERWTYNAAPMSVQDVAPGPYIVRALGRDGTVQAQGRLMVQR